MKKLIFSMFATSIFFACNSLDLPEGTPDCIKCEIKSFKRKEATCESYHVSRFETQIGYVYVFASGSCVPDGGARVLDSDCNQICYLGGDIGNINCVVDGDTLNFTDEKILWEK